MTVAPRRLGLKRLPLLAAVPGGTDEANTSFPEQQWTRKLRAVRRLVLVVLFTLPAGCVQAVLLLLPGHAKVRFARWYWRSMCALIGLRLRSIGRPARMGPGGRPVIYVVNHASWLDILVLGGRLEACFVSKAEVGRWPVINVIARLGRTVFVARHRTTTGRERDDMRARLEAGDNLILFPEGTSSDGCRVLPFRSPFFALAERPLASGQKPLVQPVSLAYDRLGYLPTGRSARAVFAWYGDMSLSRHVWRLLHFGGLRASVLLHAPLEPAAFADRKALAQAAWAAVADGAATLRQNRPASPAAAPAAPERNATLGEAELGQAVPA
jgi:1-acyl-sn-glycerol-3-phosphate acyltransferase